MNIKWYSFAGCLVLGLAVGLSNPPSAFAAVRNINQFRANHGRVTPGDTPGFPVTISRPGSYRLTTNLTLPDVPGTVGIDITAEGVELDLNGFAIIGPRVCPDEDAFLACTPAVDDGSYVLIRGGRNVTVKNGTARGSLGSGIYLGAHARLEGVNVMWNSMIAVITGKGSIIKNCLVAQSFQGILALGGDCSIVGNRIRVHTDPGIQMESTTSGYADNILDCSGPFCVLGGTQTGFNLCGGSPCP